MESIDSIDKGENDMQVLLEKQDSQFTALTEALKDSLTLSRWGPISYRNQSTNLLCKSVDWFLYDIGLHRERVKR